MRRHAGGNLAGDKFESAPRRFVIEQDAARGVHLVRLAIIPRQIEAGHLADAVRRARMEAGPLVLRRLFGLSEHLARPGEIEAALRRQVLHGRQQVVGAVDVGVERGEFVVERIADEALRGQVVALVGLHLSHRLMDAGVALERGGMQLDARSDGMNTRQPVLGVLQGHAAHDAVDVVSFLQQQFGEVGAVLAGNPGDQRASSCHKLTMVSGRELSAVSFQQSAMASGWGRSIRVKNRMLTHGGSVAGLRL